MDVLVVVDMQEAMLLGDPKHDLAAVVDRINHLAERVREQGGCVVFIQHDGQPDEEFAPFSEGWSILRSIRRKPGDRVVRKKHNDAFFGTTLRSDLAELDAERVLVAGWATDLCVDSTVRSAAALGLEVVVVSDCHTLSNRPHLSAEKVIEHHGWIWANLISKHTVRITPVADLLSEEAAR
jgi:nicotinamidase-related amidase